jgi:DNA processing protein
MTITVTNDQRRLLALCAIRVDQESVDWSLIARETQFPGGLDALWEGKVQEQSATAEAAQKVLRRGLRKASDLYERVDAELAAAEVAGARLVTVLDDDYPANLRLIPNLFLIS